MWGHEHDPRQKAPSLQSAASRWTLGGEGGSEIGRGADAVFAPPPVFIDTKENGNHKACCKECRCM